MADIRINDLPLESSPSASEFLAIDGASTRKSDIQTVVNVAAPVASQAQAEGGVENNARMTPLTTKQAIDFNSVPLSRTVTAGSGLTGGGSLSSNISLALSSSSLSSLGLANTAVQPSRQVIAGTGLSGGGSLSADVTLNLSAATQTSLGLANTAIQDGSNALLPNGGTTGQVLVKNSNTNRDTVWATVAAATAVSYSPQSLTTSQQNQVASNLGDRERLRANRTYYVRTDGNNSNDGLSNTPSGAFQTIQRAYDVSSDRIDLNGFDVTIQVADGYNTTGLAINRGLVGNNRIFLTGNTTTPGNCFLEVTNNHGVLNNINGFTVFVGGFRHSCLTAGSALWANGGNIVLNGNTLFGPSQTGDHFTATNGGVITISANYTVGNGAVNHWHAYGMGQIICQNRTVTISAPSSFTRWVGVATALVTSTGCTFVNPSNVIGDRYIVRRNGVIITEGSGATYFPGSVAGTVETGGQYI